MVCVVMPRQAYGGLKTDTLWSSLFPPCGSWGLNLGHHQVSLVCLLELSHCWLCLLPSFLAPGNWSLNLRLARQAHYCWAIPSTSSSAFVFCVFAFNFCSVFDFWGRVSLFSPVWPQTRGVLPDSTSKVLRFQVGTTTESSILVKSNWSVFFFG